jgi:hypothetical protein
MSKKQKERDAEDMFDFIMKKYVYPLTGEKETYLSDLSKVCRKFLGVKYKGTFPSDFIPRLNDLEKYCILNLDRSTEPGSHWVALAKDGPNTIFFDSFGRKNTKIIPQLEFSGNGRIVDTDSDANQHIDESNCGAKCVAWLIVAEKFGIETAKLI